MRLFCFPFAGGGAYQYKPWAEIISPDVELLAVQIPGRENRLHEPCITDLQELIQVLVRELEPLLENPYSFFGHSLGAVIAFEVCRQLRRENKIAPVHLLVSSAAAPHLVSHSNLHTGPDDDLIREVDRLGGTPEMLLRDPDMRKMLLRLLRSDFKLLETRNYVEESPLDCAITAFGSPTDTRISIAELLAWQVHTSKSFSMQAYPGGHFYLKDASIREKLVNEIGEIITAPANSLTG
jgi:medium-chain acyl-[acyl-carrier-protein] hydrolase